MFRGDRTALSTTNPISVPIETSLTTSLLIDSLYILAAFALSIGVCVFLGLLGLQFGFDVSPIGEDYVWVDLLQRGHGSGTADLWWAFSQRNPLTPWWYIAAKPVILGFDAGLLALRYAIAALLAFSAYYMVLAVAGRGSRSFALALAIVIVFWMASRGSPLIWNFQGALCASLLSVATYAHFFRGGRRPFLLSTSLVLYFLAITTYTIQCGAALAIGYLAFRRQWASNADRRSGIFKCIILAICDTVPYVALFGLFLLIWRTTIRPGVVDTFSLHFNANALFASLREGVWNADFTRFLLEAYGSPDWIIIVCVAVGCGLLAVIALWFWTHLSEVEQSIIGAPQLFDVLVVLGCIAAPTIAVESSAAYWPPGSRWPEIYQVTSPAILLACGVAMLSVITRAGELRRCLWPTLVGTAVGIGQLFWLGHDQSYVRLTRNDRHIRDSIVRLVSEDLALGRHPPEQILLVLDGAARQGTALFILSPEIARVWLQRDDISFRPMNWFPSTSGSFDSWWKVRFGSDSEGVQNAKVFGGIVPYDQIRILKISGHTAQRVLVADRSDFSGLEVEWDRDSPIAFPGVDLTELCPLKWSADQDVLASGWALPEHDQQGALRWTTSTSAHLTFPAACPDRSTLRVVLARMGDQNQDNLILRVNGKKLQYRRRTVIGNNLVYEVELPPGPLSAESTIDLELSVGALDSVGETDTRRVGVAIRSIDILAPAPERN